MAIAGVGSGGRQRGEYQGISDLMGEMGKWGALTKEGEGDKYRIRNKRAK